MQIILFNKQNDKNINFSGRLPKLQFSDFRHIPNQRCAKCHGKMLGIPERDEFLLNCQQNAIHQFKNNIFQTIQNNAIFNFFQTLVSQNPRLPFSKLTRGKDVQKQISNFSVEEQKEINQILESSTSIFKSSKSIVKKLKSFCEKYPQVPEIQKELINLMEYYSVKYPNETFHDIFRKPEVIEFHKQKFEFEEKKFQILFRKKFDAFCKLENLLTDNEKEIFRKNLTSTYNICHVSHLKKETANNRLEAEYDNLFKSIENCKIKEKIKKALLGLPKRLYNVDYAIYKVSEKNISDKDFIKSILDSVVSTFEHIVPKSRDGSDSKGNGLYFCKACNYDRSNMQYLFMQKKDPTFFENVRFQLNSMISLIRHGNLPTYQNAPFGIKQAVENETEGKLTINLKKFIDFRKREIAQKRDIIEEEINQSRQNLTQQNQEIKKLKAQLAQLKQAHNREQQKITSLQKKLEIIQHEKEKFSETLQMFEISDK